MIECKKSDESEEIQESVEEEYDYMNEETFEEDSFEDEEPDYCD